MSMISNAGSERAAQEIFDYANEIITYADPLPSEVKKALELIKDKCIEIIKECETGWY